MPSRRKTTIGFALSATIAFGSVVGGVITDDDLLLVIGVPFLILAALWLGRILVPTPTLALSPSGIQVRALAFIEWNNLERLEVFRIHGRFLGFHVHNREAIHLSASWWERLWRSINRAVEREPATVTENMIEGRFEDVVPAILRYKDVPVDWRA